MVAPSDIHPIVQRMVAKLTVAYRPQRVILFGSYAKGTPDADSDIDLLIIKATPESFGARVDAVRELLAGTHPRIPFDPIVLTPTELDQRLKIGDQFIAGILAGGRVVYAA